MPDLFLTRWDAQDPVYVPAGIVSNLKNYHIAGVRFLYRCYQDKLKGAILNQDEDMNFPVQISAFLNALEQTITLDTPALIICPDNRILKWLYHLRVYGNFKVYFTSNEKIQVKERVILASFNHINLLQSITDTEFSFVAVEQLDSISSKRILKRLRGNFNIGLSTRNFIKRPNQKIFFEMVNWTNPGVLGKYASFSREDLEHLQNLRWPYGEYWQRLTWKFCEDFVRPTDEEKQKYIDRIQSWGKQQNLNVEIFPMRKNSRKRKNQIEEKKDIKGFTSSESSNDSLQDSNVKQGQNKTKKGKVSKNHMKGPVLSNSKDRELLLKNTSEVLEETKILEKNIQNCISQQTKEDNVESQVIKPVKRRRALPLLSSSEDSQSEDDNSILISLIKPSSSQKPEQSENEIENLKMSQAQQDLCTMLEQPFDEFEKSLDSDSHTESYDVILSIMQTTPVLNVKESKINEDKAVTEDRKSTENFKGEENGKLESGIDSDTDIDYKGFKSSKRSKFDRSELRKQMLSLLSDSTMEK